MIGVRRVWLKKATLAAGAWVLPVLVGCTAIPGESSDPLFTVPPTKAAPASSVGNAPTDEPIRYPADNIWAFLASTPGLQDRASSLEEATQFAELVVIGSIAAIERGEAYGAPGEDPAWTAEAVIRVDEVLAGSPPSTDTVVVPFVLVVGGVSYPEKEFDDVSSSIPEGSAVLWLYSWQQYFERSGTEVPDWLKGADRTDRFRLIGGDGFMRIEGASVIAPGYSIGWPRDVSGGELIDVKASVMAAAAATD